MCSAWRTPHPHQGACWSLQRLTRKTPGWVAGNIPRKHPGKLEICAEGEILLSPLEIIPGKLGMG